ncbi:MAG TPA: winged helix-turn-helix domain-containing protein [Candidatus Bathyarchaeia archaeon]|nr:winged helix-turn-helix domain-containing protein [Candidatus Bathyarchaeia archaeon]
MPQKTPLANILSSSGRIKILTLLANVEQLHLSEIARRTDQSHSSTVHHLHELANASIVNEQDYGRVRLFKLNLTNPWVRSLRQLILQWDDQTAPSIQSQAQA